MLNSAFPNERGNYKPHIARFADCLQPLIPLLQQFQHTRIYAESAKSANMTEQIGFGRVSSAAAARGLARLGSARRRRAAARSAASPKQNTPKVRTGNETTLPDSQRLHSAQRPNSQHTDGTHFTAESAPNGRHAFLRLRRNQHRTDGKRFCARAAIGWGKIKSPACTVA